MNLFSEDPEFKRAQYRKISDNVSEWQEEIANVVDEKLPESMGLESVIVFQKVDEEKGYGIGSAVVRDPQTAKSVGIPILVKAWHLAPIDIFFQDEKIYPLDEDNLSKVFYHSGIGVGLAPKKRPVAMQDDEAMAQPPSGGKYSYASVSEFVEDLSGTIDPGDAAGFKGAVLADPSTLAKIARSGAFERLEKFAKAISAPKSESDAKADKLRAVETLTVKKDGPNAYRLYANPHDLFDPIMVHGDRKALGEYLQVQEARFAHRPSDILNSVDKNGTTTIKAKASAYGKKTGAGSHGRDRSPFVFDPKGDDRGVVSADKFGRFGVRDRNGVISKGFVVPNVVNFDGKKVGEKLFLGQAISSFQNRIAGIPLSDDDEINLPSAAPETGRTGVFVHQDGDQAFATVPFQVTSVSIYQGTQGLSIVTYNGKKMNLILSPAVDGIVPLKKSGRLGTLMGPGKNYMVSMKMSFVPMPKMSAVSESSDAFLKMATAELLDPNALTVFRTNNRYVFKAPMLDKYAGTGFDFQSLEPHEASFLLGSWGLGRTKIASVLNGVLDKISLEVHHLDWLDTESVTKTASADLELEAELRAIRPSFASLVKVAAMLEDAESIDMVLSLGFVNPENVSKFVAAAPMLEQTIGLLAKLLLSARIGMEDLNEDAIKQAMAHLQRTLMGVRKLGMLSTSQEKTGSVARDLGSPEAWIASVQ
ncbi:MAG: hypothetical protein DRP42_00735 [Tenericutes bacterium]|nr:MAG: hypothetical protein DRP42_00735 [Mycoplasmatota bacterium]